MGGACALSQGAGAACLPKNLCFHLLLLFLCLLYICLTNILLCAFLLFLIDCQYRDVVMCSSNRAASGWVLFKGNRMVLPQHYCSFSKI